MSLLLDTHVWLWWLTGAPNLLGIDRAALNGLAEIGLPCISAISLWEAEMLVAKRRVQPAERFDRWLRKMASGEVVQILPLDADVAAALHALPERFHGDPADRVIVATAHTYDLRLATYDAAIRKSRVVKLWKP